MRAQHLKFLLAVGTLIGGIAVLANDAAARPEGALRHLECSTDQIARYDGSKWVCSEDSSSATACGSGEVLTGGGDCASLAIPQVIYPPKYVFLSTHFTNGNISYSGDSSLTGIQAADAVCQSLAEESVLLPYGKYLAWLSDAGTSPNNSFYHSPGPYILVDGTVVAANYADLTDGSLAVPINMDQNGNSVTPGNTFPYAWTNTNSSGDPFDSSPCNGWTSADIGLVGQVGNYTTSGGNWTNVTRSSCINSLRLYCVQQ